MHFALQQKVLFKHCDPAGIVFYPRYFEIINDTIEAMFADLLGWPFEELHKEGGVPTVHIDVDFKAVSRHGDRLDLEVTINRLGGSSMDLHLLARDGEEVRFVAQQTLVCVDREGRARHWPAPLRSRIDELLERTP
ncbi:MAG: thioesterase [Rhodobacterales bacterium]|nr:MAG: thioesterase [Rhodobacterales bacterium]